MNRHRIRSAARLQDTHWLRVAVVELRLAYAAEPHRACVLRSLAVIRAELARRGEA